MRMAEFVMVIDDLNAVNGALVEVDESETEGGEGLNGGEEENEEGVK